MSEIGKMYRTIFGEFAPNCSLCVKLVDCKIFNNTHNCNKFECDYKSLFTVEKQLKLIEFFISSVWWMNLKSLHKTLDCSLNFEDKLARMVNYLWLSLTEEEKQQIKEILE